MMTIFDENCKVPLKITSLLLLMLLYSIVTAEEIIYSGCDADTYYSSLSNTPDRFEIGNLLKSTHQNVLPYTSSKKEDTWDALADLDSGLQQGYVQLIYSGQQAEAFPTTGQDRSWNREHLWPKSHGVGYDGADFTDVHHLRPADSNVNSARSNKYFAACGVVLPLNQCRSPAHVEASNSTETDSQVWLPPTDVRGDVARAMFYMEHRYYGSGGDPKLELTDCPTAISDTKLAYLSQLLEWHKDDPVDEAEKIRNQRVCERWQGNRNIFVDFPDLVTQIYGQPKPLPSSDGAGYECNDVTPPPATDSPPTSCDGLNAGDVQVIQIRSDNPDEIGLVALEHLAADLEISITDSAWTGTEFRNSEGTATLVVPSGGIPKGTVFGYGADSSLLYSDSWAKSGSLALSATGDSVIVYCTSQKDASYNFLAAVTYNDGGWEDTTNNGDLLDSNQSRLPPGLEMANTALPHFDNYYYTGPTKGTKSELVALIADSRNWEGSNEPISATFESFSVSDSLSSSPNSTGKFSYLYICFLLGLWCIL